MVWVLSFRFPEIPKNPNPKPNNLKVEFKACLGALSIHSQMLGLGVYAHHND